jgi:hypothetical protein
MKPRWDQYIGRLPPMGRQVLQDAAKQSRNFRDAVKLPGQRDDNFYDHPVCARLVDSAASKVRSMYPENFRQV